MGSLLFLRIYVSRKETFSESTPLTGKGGNLTHISEIICKNHTNAEMLKWTDDLGNCVLFNTTGKGIQKTVSN
jgi:hypothetical protein